MTPRCLVLVVGLLALFSRSTAWGEDGILVVHVTYLDKKPLAHVRIGTTGDGSIEVTDIGGRARLHLAPGVKADQEVELQVVPGEKDQGSWVFISPWNQRLRVPPFEGGEAVAVVLAKKADKEALLGSSEGRKAVEQSILSELSKLRQAKSEITEEQRRMVLQGQAAAYGLKPEEVDDAIRTASQKSPDLYEQGLAALYEKNYLVASDRLEKALAESEKELADVSEKVADQATFLGDSLFQQGRYHEVVAAYRRAASLRREDPDTLDRLGMALLEDGDFKGAEASLDRALVIARAIHAPNIEWIIQSNISNLLRAKGDLLRARQLGVRVVEAFLVQFGANHPYTLQAMSNLAVSARMQGDLIKARQLEEEVLSARLRELGADHPDTIASISNLAVTLSDQGELAKARQMQEQVLEFRRHFLGADHPDTLTALANLANTAEDQGDLTMARHLQEEVLRSSQRLLGANHPDTLRAMNDLATTLLAQGELLKARQLEEVTVDASLRIMGADHEDTLGAISNLGFILFQQGELTKARQLQEQALEGTRRRLGMNHRHTLLAMNNLAITIEEQGDIGKARQMQEQALELSLRLFGAENVDTLKMESNLADMVEAQGDLRQARLLYEQVLESSLRSLGAEHFLTLGVMGNLAETMRKQGDSKARTMLEQLVEVSERILGPTHEITSVAKLHLLKIYERDRDREGIQKLEKSLACLLDVDESNYSALHRKVLDDLKKLQEGRKD